MIVISLFSILAFVTSQAVAQQSCSGLSASLKLLCSLDPSNLISSTSTNGGTSDEDTNDKPKCRQSGFTGYCPIRYDGKCFWAYSRQINYEAAKDICRIQGGKPANIYSEDHHYMMKGYLRNFATSNGAFAAWLGMTYNNDTKTLLLRDGTKAPFAKWIFNHPDKVKCCQPLMLANLEMKNNNDLMTWDPKGYGSGVLCERSVPDINGKPDTDSLPDIAN